MPLLMAAAEMCGDNERGNNYRGSQAKGTKGQTWTILFIPFPCLPPADCSGFVLGYKALKWVGMKAIFAPVSFDTG